MQVDLTMTEIRLLADLVQRFEADLEAKLALTTDLRQDPKAPLILSLLADLRSKLSCSEWSSSTCSYCGTQFVGIDPAARFCSERCRRRFDRLAARAIRNLPSLETG